MYQKYTLQNGLRVITVPRDDTESVTVLVLVGAGSRYETRRVNGVAHFVEHMMFKGTKKRPTTLDISRELDRYGADYNAYTGKDHTGYYIKINSDHIDLALDLLSDMLLNSRLDERELDRERGVIIEEIKMYNDNPLMHAPDLFERVLYGDRHQLGWSIVGTDKIISTIPRRALADFVSKQYRPRNMVVCVAGNFSGLRVGANGRSLVHEHVGKYFHYKNSGALHHSPTARRFSGFSSNRRILIHSKQTEQVQMILGTPAFSYKQRGRFALAILSVILGGNMSSRLFIRVRERLGLAYFVRADVSSYEDTGSFSIQAGVDPSKIDKAIRAIMKELSRVVRSGVTKQELANAKEFIKGKISLSMEDSSALAEWFGRQEILTGTIDEPRDRMKQLERVTREEVKGVAGKLLKNGKFYLSLIGPYDKSEAEIFSKLLHLT